MAAFAQVWRGGHGGTRTLKMRRVGLKSDLRLGLGGIGPVRDGFGNAFSLRMQDPPGAGDTHEGPTPLKFWR